MLPSNDPSRNPKPQPPLINSMRFVTIGGEIGCVTLIIVLASVFGGLWLDNMLGTKPVITLILVLGSAPFSLMLTVWLARRSLRDLQSPTQQDAKDRDGL